MRVEVSGFRVSGSELRVLDELFRVEESVFGVWGLRFT
jgi:hypothetical protein